MRVLKSQSACKRWILLGSIKSQESERLIGEESERRVELREKEGRSGDFKVTITVPFTQLLSAKKTLQAPMDPVRNVEIEERYKCCLGCLRLRRTSKPNTAHCCSSHLTLDVCFSET